MYLYQTVRQKQDRKIKVILALCVAGVLLFMVECPKYASGLKKGVTKLFYQEMVSYCIPLLGYYNGYETEISLQERVLNYFFPVLEQGREKIHYQTEIESDFSYEMILAMEAADEN